MKVAVLVSVVFGWGSLGHDVIGDIATAFLTQESKVQIAKLFGSKYTIGDLSNWADYVKRYPEYATWSPVLHYLGVNYHRFRKPEFDEQVDCPEGKCVVGAIATYTLQSNCKLPLTEQRRVQRREAFKFLIHFIGETTQPLHVCGRDRGGVQTTVTIDGITGNFHYIWDTVIIQKRIQTAFNRQREGYVTYLVNSITAGQYKAIANTWLSKEEATATSRFGNSLAALDWIRDTAGVGSANCGKLWDAYEQYKRQDFGDKYSRDNMRGVDLQLAKAGYRLAHHLNQIFKDCL